MAQDSGAPKLRQAMAWIEQHDILLCREILHTQPWLHRHGSVEGGQLWDEIAAVLNSLEKPGFKVTSRSVCDRYGLLVKKYITKWNEERKSSGRNPDYTGLDGALMDLIQRFDEADLERKRETNEKKSKIENELAKAQEMRQTSLETFCQTKKRKESDIETPQKRRRSSVSQDYLSYFSVKSEREFQLRQEELKIKKQELDVQERQLSQAQQAQQAQFLLMQQQNNAMLEFIKSMQSKQ